VDLRHERGEGLGGFLGVTKSVHCLTTFVPGDRIDMAANYDMTNHHGDGRAVMGIGVGFLDLG
jgi:hypothetical protein